MGLVLTLGIGDDFYVQNQQVIVDAINSPTEFVLHRVVDGRRLAITASRALEIFKGVFVSAGARGQNQQVRITIEAPQSILLLRGSNYRKGKPS